MYNLLLVDDEPLIKVAFQSAVEWGKNGIEIGIVAQHQNRTGKAALFQFMNERKPIHAGHFQVRARGPDGRRL